ncbi:TorF family putative porin [Gallaecimonas sp. GXIMD1310]|uniref:TorF family putative porin n=1 Tax=Gallaecimonas sp. GXIMD1310 TaxID=3131926 RepID=UPI003244C359
MKKTLLLAMLASGFAVSAQATDLSATVAGASDYLFNGISQTSENPSLQLSLDAGFDRGFYVGTWASNVDFGAGDNAKAEWDFYGGYSADFGQGWNYDISLSEYTYVGESSYNYPEAHVALTAPTNTMVRVSYTWDQAGTGINHAYVELHQGYELDNGVTLQAAYTYSKALSGAGHQDYWYGKDHYSNWLVGMTTSYKGIDIALNWQDTNIKGVPEAGGRIYLAVSKSFEL